MQMEYRQVSEPKILDSSREIREPAGKTTTSIVSGSAKSSGDSSSTDPGTTNVVSSGAAKSFCILKVDALSEIPVVCVFGFAASCFLFFEKLTEAKLLNDFTLRGHCSNRSQSAAMLCSIQSNSVTWTPDSA
jgi:hypothetical protein